MALGKCLNDVQCCHGSFSLLRNTSGAWDNKMSHEQNKVDSLACIRCLVPQHGKFATLSMDASSAESQQPKIVSVSNLKHDLPFNTACCCSLPWAHLSNDSINFDNCHKSLMKHVVPQDDVMNVLKPGFTPQSLRDTRSPRVSASLLNLFTSSSEPQEVFQLGLSQ